MILDNPEINKTIIGVFLGGKTLRVGKVVNAEVMESFTEKINTRESKEIILSKILISIEKLMDKTVDGIGIGVPSLVDTEHGIVYNVQNIPSWKEVHLKQILEEKFGVRVYVNNDANCFAIGEKYFGKAQGYNNIVGIVTGTGMGAGIVFDGKLFSGSNCGAGEFGSIPYKKADLEHYCSDIFFEEKYGLKSEDVYERAKQKDKIALAIFEQFGLNLGIAIKIIMYSVDPEIVVIGGPLSKAFPFFENSMWEMVETFTYVHSVKRLKIEQSVELDIAILGAAALYLDATNHQISTN